MATVQYNVIPGNTVDLGVETYSTSDTALVNSFEINSQYNVDEHFIELHTYSVAGELLTSVYNYQNEKQLLNSAGAGQEGASTLYIDPVADANSLGYSQGGVTLLYHFLKPIIGTSLYISEISPDRLEIRAKGVELSEVFLQTLVAYKTQLQSNSYFTEFRLNFLENNLYIGVNLEVESDGSIIIKLYEALPSTVLLKSTFTLVELVADSVSYQVEAITTPEPEQLTYLKGPNFTLEDREQNVLSTGYLDYNELYTYPVTGSYHKILLQASQSGVQVSIDYSDYNNFVHFSSAQERLENFSYKLGLVQYYESKSLSIKNTLATSASAAVSESSIYYDSLVSGIISKFDGYEQYLYFESTSFAWPKSNSLPPFINLTGSNPTVTNWYSAQLASASLYDELNQSNLVYTIPEFIRQDSSNAPYSLFLNMIGQHFDNIWIYAKAVTDKYDTDNRLDYGISRDLVGEALKSFGVKLYSSNFSVSNLSSLLLGEWYDSGSEQITSFVTASNSPTPDKDIIQETYKRLYHNLPYLIKTKGTERGLRALINCFGIPSGSLEIKEFGGVGRSALPYSAAETGSVDKIRVSNTGSIVPGSTLSQYASIQNPAGEYTEDIHTLEVGFSPTYYVDKYIVDNITGSFNIDDYIGDPRTAHDSRYTALQPFISSSLGNLSRYDMFDFVRLIKFFDNQVFKMVKDFVPVRASATTGIIIKPHLLERNKVKQPLLALTQPEYTASIDTAFFEAQDGGVVDNLSTAYTASVVGILGTVQQIQSTEVEKYNGELGGTVLDLYVGNLNGDNPFFENNPPSLTYQLTQYLTSKTPGAGFDEISEQDFFTTLPLSTGNMYFFWDYNSKIGYNYLKYIWFRNTSYNGVNSSNAVREFTTIVVNGTTYTGFQKNILGGNNTLLTLPDPGTGFAFNAASYPTTATVVPVILLPYVPSLYYNSDYNALLNNATVISNAANVQKLNYSTNPLIPDNIGAVLTNTAEKAEVQELLYSSPGLVSSRYAGQQLVGASINTYTKGDKSYGKTPVLEHTTPYFCVFDYVSGFSPEHNQANAVVVSYIVDEEGNLITPDSPTALSLLQQGFPTDTPFELSIQSSAIGGSEARLLGTQKILKSGARIEPILYSYTASQYLVPEYSPSFALEFDVDDTLVTYDVIATGSSQNPSNNYNTTTQILFQKELKDDAGYYTDGATSTFYFSEDSQQPVKFAVSIDSIGSGVYNYYTDDYAYSEVEYRLEKSSDSTFSLGSTTTLDSEVIAYTVSTGVEVNLTSSLSNYSSGSAVRVVVTPLDPYLNNLTLGTRIFQVISEQSGSTYVSQSDNLQGYFFATGSGAGSTTVLTASLSLSSKYENVFIGVNSRSGTTYTYNTQGFNTVTLPFTVQVGDEIKFNNDENRAYLVTKVQTPYENAEQVLYVTLNRKVSSAVNKDFFAIRRYVDTSSMVLMKTDRVRGTQNTGILFPKYPSPRLKANYENIISTLKNKGIL
jgi:hypothetical protein